MKIGEFLWVLVGNVFVLCDWAKKTPPLRKGASAHYYEIRLRREAVNFLLHIIAGVIVTYTFILPASVWYSVVLLATLGIFRELWQWYRGKMQPYYIHLLDVASITLGGPVTYWLVWLFNINLDTI